MQTIIPKPGAVFKILLRADLITQWRNRRSVILVVLVPVVILIAWKPLVKDLGGASVLSNCITVGLNAIGLMGYSTSVARDREKGIFQRIRVAPIPTWCIMISRILVQLTMIMFVTLAIFAVGYSYDKVVLGVTGYALGFAAALAGGALYLSLGQAIVGLVKNSETVNATSRLVYFLFIMVGMFGELGMLGPAVHKISGWSPYGAVNHLLADSLHPASWNMETTKYLLLTLGYAIVFSAVGIKNFKWETK